MPNYQVNKLRIDIVNIGEIMPPEKMPGQAMLERDVTGKLLVTFKTCCDCSSGLRCQTHGRPRVITVPPHWSNSRIGGQYTECQRPLGLMSRPLVPLKTKYDFLWYSPIVPIRVKIDTLVAIADKACDMYDSGIGVPDKDRGYNLRKVFGEMHEAQKEYWGVGRVGVGHKKADIGARAWLTKRGRRYEVGTNNYADHRVGLLGCVSHAYRALCFELPHVAKRLGNKKRQANWECYWAFVNDCAWAGLKLVQVLAGTNDFNFTDRSFNDDHVQSLLTTYDNELRKLVEHLVAGYRRYGETRGEEG